MMELELMQAIGSKRGSWRRACAAALAIVAAVSLSTATRLAAQSTEPLIRVGLGPEDDSKPLVYAVQSGLFRRAGLNVQLTNLAGSAVIAAALAGGSLDIGKGSPAGVIAAYAKGLPFTVIGGSAFYTASSHPVALIVASKSTVKTPQDFVGTTMGAVTLQDLSTLATFAWLTQHGVDWKSAKFIEMPASQALAAMEADRAVGMTVYEPTSPPTWRLAKRASSATLSMRSASAFRWACCSPT